MRRKKHVKQLFAQTMAFVIAAGTMSGTAYPVAYADSGSLAITETPGTATKVSGISYPENVAMTDSNAIDAAGALYSYLKGVGNSPYVLYGHQNDTHHKGGGNFEGSTASDTKDLTGSIAAVVGIDTLSLTGAELPLKEGKKDSIDEAAAISAAAAGEGAVITMSSHMPNFALVKEKGTDRNGTYDYSGYTSNITTGTVMEQILPGGELNEVYNGYLDLIARYALNLQDAGIPVLFRPFHENNGSWFWWGAAFCDAETYKNVYRYTVEYLRDGKGVHNFLYVYSPNGPFKDKEDYESRYPGDNYVDVISFDMYHDKPQVQDNWMKSFQETVALVDELAAEHGKLSAVAETGMRVEDSLGDGNSYSGIAPFGNRRKEWFKEIEDIVSPSNMAYYMVWANFDDRDNFFSPYRVDKTSGHEMANAFIRYYNSDTSVFADGTNFYSQVPSPSKSSLGISGYIVNPVSGSRMITPDRVYASLSERAESVSFVLYNEDRSVQIPVEAKRVPLYYGLKYVYGANITREHLNALGKTVGSIELEADGQVLASNAVIYNIDEPDSHPAIIDQFEGYLGKSELLMKNWTVNTGMNCSIAPEITSSENAQGDYGLEFRYHITPGSGQEGWAGMTKKFDGDFSGCNGLQLWIKPDGRGQKLVIQITSAGEEFEAYLTDFAATTEAGYVTIPFSAFVGKNKGTFDVSDVTGFGVWCNTVGTSDVSSVMYFDDIHGVQTDLTAAAYHQERLESPSGHEEGSEENLSETENGQGEFAAVQKRQIIPELMHLGPALAYGQGREEKSAELQGTTTELLSEGSYETWECKDVSWLMNGADTDYVTVEYTCTDASKGGWGILGWGATVNGQWTSGPSYMASETDPLERASAMISIKALRRNFKIKNGARAEEVRLNTWNGGQIKKVTLTQGASIPRSPVLVEDAAPDRSWVCMDVEYLRDLPADKILNLTITCTDPGHRNWQIMNWGAKVDGLWVNGPVYNAADRSEYKIQISYTLGEFLALMGITEDSLVEYLELSVYNGGKIVRLSIDDMRLPSYSYQRRMAKGGSSGGGSGSDSSGSESNPFNSEYEKIIAAVEAGGDRVVSYDSLTGTISGWGQLEAQDSDIVSQIREGNFLVIRYENSDGAAPKLWPKVDGIDYRTVDAVWADGKYAVYTYQSIAAAFKGYMIPMDFSALSLAAGSVHEVEIQAVYVYTDKDSPIQDSGNFITELWAQHELELTKYNSGYKTGDEVTVSITFDREISGFIGANIGGQWDSGTELSGTTITRTLTPDEAKVFVSVSDFKGGSYAEIKEIRVDVTGRLNYDAAVEINAPQSLGVSRTEAEDILKAAGVSDEEVSSGTKLVVTMKEEELTQEMLDALENAPTEEGEKPIALAAIDISMEKVNTQGNSQNIHEIGDKVRFVLAVPEGADRTQKFVVARIYNGQVEWLKDLDDNPDTVTIETDRFSTHVISQTEMNTDHIVSDDEIAERGIYGYNSLERLRNVMDRAENGESITIAFLGGSITQGYVAEPMETFCWAYRTYQWWEKTFPDADITYVNAGIGGTDSYQGVHRVVTDVLDHDPDLVIVEFSVNDYQSHNQESYESLIRRILQYETNPAVMSLFVTQTDDSHDMINYSKYHKEVVDYYHIPAVSYADVIEPVIKRGDWTLVGNAADLVHPNNDGHHVIYRCMKYFFEQVRNDSEQVLGDYTPYVMEKEPMTSSRYENGQLLDHRSDSGVRVASGTAEPEYFPAAQFHYGWAMNTGEDVTFHIDDATNIGVIFYGSTDPEYAKYDVYVDGKYSRTIDSYGAGKFGDAARYELLLTSGAPGEHTVTFKLNEDSRGTIFSVLGFTVSSSEGEVPESIYTFHKEDIVEDPVYPGWLRAIQNFRLSSYLTEPANIGSDVLDIEFTLESEKGFTGSLGVGEFPDNNWVSQAFDEDGNAVLTMTAAPAYDTIQMTIESMEADTVTVKDIRVSKAESLTPENPSVNIDLRDYVDQWEEGNAVKIDVKFSHEVTARIDDHEVTGREISQSFIPKSSSIVLEITDFKGEKEVQIQSLHMSLKGIHTLDKTYNEGALETKLSTYMENPDAFRNGTETTVTVMLDREIEGRIGANVNDSWNEGDSLKGIQWTRTFVPSSDYLNIFATNLEGNTSAEILSVTVEQAEEETTEALYEFTDTWGSNDSQYNTKFSEWLPDIEFGQAAEITLIFDVETGVKLAGMTEDGKWKDYTTVDEGNQTGTEHSFTITPESDDLYVQVTSIPEGKDTVKLLSVVVEQEIEPIEFLYEFTDTWGSNGSQYDTGFSDWFSEIELGQEAKVTLTFDVKTGVKLSGMTEEGTWKDYIIREQKKEEHSFTITPESDDLYIQITSIPEGRESVKLLSVMVEQEEKIEQPPTNGQIQGGVTIPMEEIENLLPEGNQKPEEGQVDGNQLPEGNTAPEGDGSEENTVPEGNGSEENTAPEDNGSEENAAPEGDGSEENTAPEGNGSEENAAPEGNGSEENAAPEGDGSEENAAPEGNGSEENAAPEGSGNEESTAPEEDGSEGDSNNKNEGGSGEENKQETDEEKFQ